jgi:hypothetical protein
MFDAKRIFLVGDAGHSSRFENREGKPLARLRPPPDQTPPATGPPG